MKAKLKLALGQSGFEELHQAVDRARKGTTAVKVSRAALSALLRDHSKLLRMFEGKIDDEI